MKNCAICNKEFPSWIKIDGKYRNLKNRKYCLECSPFGKHNTIKLEKRLNTLNIFKICIKCKLQKPTGEFYQKSDRKNGSSFCKKCFNSYCSERWIKTKIKAIEYKGSKCQDCSISYPQTDYCVFDFHHRNPSEKDVDWKELRKRSWNKIIFELDKCDLLCSNCHRLKHKRI
jgi:hypothetical protein